MGLWGSFLGVAILALALVCCDAFHQPSFLWRWRPGSPTPLSCRGVLRPLLVNQGEYGGREERSTMVVAGAKMDGVSGSAGKKKVAVVGAGAVGLYYGARLREAGHDVSFLARRDLDAMRQGGLTISSPDGDMRIEPSGIKVFGSTKEIGEVDWIMLSLKSYSLPAAKELVEPCMGAGTRIVAIMNGYGIEDALALKLPREKIFGGMAFICSNRGDPGYVEHSKYGPLLIGHGTDDEKELVAIQELFEGSKVAVTTSESLLCSRWDKLCWNIPFNGLAVAMGGITTDKIVGDADLRELATKVMKEVVAAGNADLDSVGADARHRLDEEEIVERLFRLTDNMGPYRPSTMIDMVQGRPMEVDFIFGNPLARARELGVAVPHMESVISMIKAHQRLRNL